MGQTSTAMRVLTALCAEAVRLHGGDWARVEAHVKDGLDKMPPDEREAVGAALERILRPAGRGAVVH